MLCNRTVAMMDRGARDEELYGSDGVASRWAPAEVRDCWGTLRPVLE